MTEAALEADRNADWDEVLDGWTATRSNLLLRRYSDCANRRLLRAWLPELDAQRVLKTDLFDEAVGEGLYPLLRDAGAVVTAVDVSERVLAAARARYPELQAGAADLRRLPYETGAFDAIVSNSTLDHFRLLADVESAVRELHRVLRPGGRLLITFDNPLNPLVALRNALPFEPLRRVGLVPYFVGITCGPRELQELLRQAGFSVLDLRPLMHFPRVVARAASSVMPGDPLVRLMLASERLGSLPTRYRTGQFVAALAEKPQREPL